MEDKTSDTKNQMSDQSQIRTPGPDQPWTQSGAAKSTQEPEAMEVEMQGPATPPPSPGRANQQLPHDTSAITTQPLGTSMLNPGPFGHSHTQEDAGPTSLRGPDSMVLLAAQISSSPSESPSAGAQGQQQDHLNMAESKDLTSSSASKGPDTKPKKRDTTLLRSNSVSQAQDTVDDDDKNPSAPRDVAKVYMTVDWPGDLPPKWRYHLQKALQTWCHQHPSNEQQKWEVDVVHLLGDERTAEVEVTPSTALKDIKSATLTFKDFEQKSAKVQFQKDKPKSMDKDSSLKDNTTVTEMIQPENMKDGGAAAKVPGDTDMSGAPHDFTVPHFLYWYLSQAYKDELEQIENKFGVQITAETRVSFSATKPHEKSESDSISRAARAFSDLYLEKVNHIKSVAVSQSHMGSDVMKQVLQNIPNKEHKILLSMSASNNLLLAPEAITSMVEKRLDVDPAKSSSHNKPHNTETDTEQWRSSGSSSSRQTPKNLDMHIEDTQATVEMDETHWHLTYRVFEKQLQEIQNKYGVQFHAESVQGLVKVSARSRGTGQVNLEVHALRALTHLYQKVVTSAVTCDLKDASSTEIVSQAFARIRTRHTCVAEGQRNGIWALFGLPKHLIPAIADMEKIIGHDVFNKKTKQSLGHPWVFPQAGVFQGGQMEVEGMRGAHGTDLRGGAERKSLEFNRDSVKEEKDGKKGTDKSEEDRCSICLDTFTNKEKLNCGHEFCKECLEGSINAGGRICPICKKIFGTLIGNQPDGTMDVRHISHGLPGFSGFGTIEITYRIRSGTQTNKHPNPGKPFTGTTRTAYLPDNAEGNHVLSLLRKAFDQKLIFTVGESRTTGAGDTVTWNDIHHKTSVYGGPEGFGYPDPDYLTRVQEELKAKGIE